MRKQNLEKKINDAVKELEQVFAYKGLPDVASGVNARYHAERALCILCTTEDYEVESGYFCLSERDRKIGDFKNE